MNSGLLGAALLVLAIANVAARPGWDESDMQIVYKRFVQELLPSDASALAELKEAVSNEYLPHFNASCLFDDIDYASTRAASWPVMSHLSRLSSMATLGRAGVNESTLAPMVDCGLDWWLRVKPRCSNWYDQEISGPNNIGTIMLLLPNGTLAPNQSAVAGQLVAEADWEQGWTGSNLLFMLRAQLMRGLYFSNETLVAQAFQVAFGAMHTFNQNTDGPQDDHSFHQHGPQLLAGSYGSEFTGHVIEFAFLGQATQWAAPQDALEALSGLLLDGQQFMMIFDTPSTADPSSLSRAVTWDWQVTGRSTASPPGVSDPRSFITPSTVGFIAQSNATGRQSDWQAFHARLLGVGPAEPLRGSRSYWDSDFVAHAPISGAWRFSLHMRSSRTIGGSCVNDQGKLARRKSNGATALYYSGSEYRNSFPLWDFYRPPGVTGPVGDGFELNCGNAKVLAGASFVGGVSLPSGRSFAVMEVDDEDELKGRRAWFMLDGAVVALGAGLTTLRAGATLQTTLDTSLLRPDVFAGNFASSLSGGLSPLPQGNVSFPLSGSAGEAVWLLHNNTAYIVPTDSAVAGPAPPAELVVWNQPKTGNWFDIGVETNNVTEDLFDSRLVHSQHASTGSSGASYAYVIVPAVASPSDVPVLAKSLAGLSIVRSSVSGTAFAAQEAVLDGAAAVLGAALWEANAGSAGPGSPGFAPISAGAGWSVAATEPCVLGLDVTASAESSGGSSVTLALATPGAGGASVSVFVDRALVCAQCHSVTAGVMRGQRAGAVWTRVDVTTPGGNGDGDMMGAPVVVEATAA